MMKMKTPLLKISAFALAAAATLTLSGCGGLNSMLVETEETHEYLRIFDVPTTDVTAKQLGESLTRGIKLGFSNPKVERPLIMDPVPETPGRITTDDMLKKSGFGKLMHWTGNSTAMLRIAMCEGAPYRATATRGNGDDWDGRITVCVFPYKKGYHVDMYGYLSVKKGGIREAVRGAVFAAMGDPVEWIEKCMLDVMRTARKELNVPVTLVEANPDIEGTPWLLDPGMDIPKAEGVN